MREAYVNNTPLTFRAIKMYWKLWDNTIITIWKGGLQYDSSEISSQYCPKSQRGQNIVRSEKLGIQHDSRVFYTKDGFQLAPLKPHVLRNIVEHAPIQRSINDSGERSKLVPKREKTMPDRCEPLWTTLWVTRQRLRGTDWNVTGDMSKYQERIYHPSWTTRSIRPDRDNGDGKYFIFIFQFWYVTFQERLSSYTSFTWQ
jgi:hypothetical protein